jgi:acid phosphatase (class A)
MTISRRVLVWLWLSAALFTPLVAVEPYLQEGAPDALTLIPAPPAVGSVEDLADRDSAFRVYSAHTAADFARGKNENILSVFHFSDVVGAWFQPGKLPKTEVLFREVESETRIITNKGKNFWNRKRPYVADPARFPDPIDPEEKPSASYPSGHSTRGALYSLLLAELFPEKKDELFLRGRLMGWTRIQGGVHTPADIFAGRVLGQALAQAFLRNPRFQHDLADVKAEIAAAAK